MSSVFYEETRDIQKETTPHLRPHGFDRTHVTTLCNSKYFILLLAIKTVISTKV